MAEVAKMAGEVAEVRSGEPGSFGRGKPNLRHVGLGIHGFT